MRARIPTEPETFLERKWQESIERRLDLLEKFSSHVGWYPTFLPWEYVSATTIQAPKDITYIPFSARVRIEQSSMRYGVVVGKTGQNLTIFGDAVLNEPIRNVFFSLLQRPASFPTYFNFTPTFQGFVTNPTGGFRAATFGNLVHVTYRPLLNLTSNGTTFTMTLPITVANIANYRPSHRCTFAVDNGVEQPAAYAVADPGTNILQFAPSKDAGPGRWTNSGEKWARGDFFYEF